MHTDIFLQFTTFFPGYFTVVNFVLLSKTDYFHLVMVLVGDFPSYVLINAQEHKSSVSTNANWGF